MGFSITQQKFNDAFIFRSNSLIDELFATISTEPNWHDALEEKLEQGSILVSGAVATVGIATIAAPATGGISLAAAGAVLGTIGAGIAITQLASGGYRFFTNSTQGENSETSELEISIDENKLLFKMVAEELGDTLTVRYRNFIDDIVEPDNIPALAYFAAEQIVKAMQKSILAQIKSYKLTHISSQNLSFHFDIDDLIGSLHKTEYSLRMKPADKVRIQAKHIPNAFMASKYVPIKWVFIRPRVALFTNILGTSSLDFYKSATESTHFGSKVTLPQYGYVATDNQQVIHQRNLISCDFTEEEVSQLEQTLCFYYSVSSEEVAEYLQNIRSMDHDTKPSLNSYLSAKYKVSIIAECHDDSLQNLDLSGGIFAEVNFRGATFSGNLDNTNWENARLQNCKFVGANLTSNTNFNYAKLQKSIWQDLNFLGSFVHAKLSAAFISNCVIADFNHIGCDWELVYIDASCRHPLSNIEWREATEKRLTDELNSRKQIAESAHQEYLAWQISQQERWEAQEKINSENLDRLQSIEAWINADGQKPILDILTIMHRQGARYQEVMISEPYVDLNLLPAGVANTQASISLIERLLSFRDDPLELFFLLHGAIGSGKSVAATRLHQELLLSCKDQNDIYPIFIKLKHVQHITSSNFLEQCLLTQFDHAQIAVLKEHFTCLVILDGLEDCGISINDRYLIEECLLFNQDCNKGSWKVLLTASTQYLLESRDYRERLRLSLDVNFPYESEYSILPLNHTQINTYIENYYADKISSSGISPKDLYNMAQTPIMLHLMCEVLSSPSFVGSTPRSKVEFYQAFLDNWSEHVLQKTAANRLTPRSILIYLQDFAYQMFTEDKHHIEWPIYDERDVLEIERDSETCKRNDFSYLFDKPMWKKAGTLAPLKVKRDDNREIMIYQIRQPFRMYALANKLLSLLRQTSIQDVINSWNYAYLADSTTFTVFESLSALVISNHSKDFFIDILCQIVDASCAHDGHLYAKAASNAITLLNCMGYDFSVNLNHDRWRGAHINKANLRYGKFVGFDFSGADLRDTKWQYAELIGVNMDGADTEGATFFDGLSSIYTKKDPETFAVYPSDEPVIAYSALKRVGSEEREIVLVGTNGNKYPPISGHQTEIKDMAWGVINTQPPVAYLASASIHGTVRVWRVDEDKSKEIIQFKVKSEHAINSVRWYKDGDLIATAGDDNYVRIWSMCARKLVFIYNLQTRVNSVIFGRDEKVLLSVDDLGRLSVWDINSLHRSSKRQQPPQVQTSSAQDRGRALSTALSVPEKYVAVGYENGDIVTFALGMHKNSQDGQIAFDATISQVLRQHTRAVNSIVWNAHCLVSGGEDGLIIVWNPSLGISLAVYHGDGVPVNQVAWLMGGRQVLTSQDRRLAIYDPDYQPESSDIKDNINSTITQVAAIDKYVAMGDVDGKIWLWNVESIPNKSLVNTFTLSSEVKYLAWSLNQRYLVAISKDNVLKVVDIFSPDLAESVINLTTEFLSVKWTVDSDSNAQKLLVFCEDRRILYVARDISREFAWQIEDSPENSLGIASTLINSLDIALDAQASFINCAAYANRQLRIYYRDSLSLFSMIFELNPRQKEVKLLSYSADYQYLLVKFYDETFTVFNTDTWNVVWRDDFPSYEKKLLWLIDENNTQWLLVGTRDDLTIYRVQEGLQKACRILKSVDSLAFKNGFLYLVEKKSVDMLDFAVIARGDEYKNAFITRFGFASTVLDLNLTNVLNMDSKTKKIAKYQGAILNTEQRKSSLQSTVLNALGLYQPEFSKLPRPTVQTSTSQRVMHSFYRSNSSLNEAESTSTSGSPVKLVRDTSDGNPFTITPIDKGFV